MQKKPAPDTPDSKSTPKKTLAQTREDMLAELQKLKKAVLEDKDFIPVSVEKDKSKGPSPTSVQGQILNELNRLENELLKKTEYESSADEYSDDDGTVKQESEQLFNLMNLRNQFVTEINKVKQMSGGVMEMQSKPEVKPKSADKENPISKLLSGLKKLLKK